MIAKLNRYIIAVSAFATSLLFSGTKASAQVSVSDATSIIQTVQRINSNSSLDCHSDANGVGRETATLINSKDSKKKLKFVKKKCVPDSVNASTISLADAGAIFNLLAAEKDIPFKYPEDGCYARSLMMDAILFKRGLQPAQIYLSSKDKMTVLTANSPKGFVK